MKTKEFYNHQTKELQDDNILEALEQAIDKYESGDPFTVKHLLQDVLTAIKQFENDFEKGDMR